jgi:phage terminase small subunit
LTPKQEAFVAEFLIDLNGAKAAIRAGYSARTAGEQAYDLLRNPDIAAAIERGRAQRAQRTRMEQDMVINEMAHLGFSCITHYAVDEETGDLVLRDGAPLGAMAAVQSVRHRKRVRVDKDGAVVTTYDTAIRLWDKPKALFLLGRHVGLFADRIEHTGPNGGPIETVKRIERIIISLPCGSLALNSNTEVRGALPAADAHIEKG